MNNFDGIETDIRLTRDNKLVIHHDPVLSSGKMIASLTKQELVDAGIPAFENFIYNKEVESLVQKGKRALIELKPNCRGTIAISDEIAKTFSKETDELLASANFSTDQITFISFSEKLLKPLVDRYKCAPLLPALNECKVKQISGFTKLRLFGKFFAKRLPSYMKYAKNEGFTGTYVAREYFLGILSSYHGRYKKKLELAKSLDFELGTNLGTSKLEPDFPELLRVTDDTSIFPRYSKKDEGSIIAHRGTGTKGVELSSLDGKP